MSLKILVVDDEPDVQLIFRQKFRRRIRKGELEFAFAEHGRAALEVLRADPTVSIVFTDINMPVMNGLALLREIRTLDRALLVPLIISAYDDMANIREAMNQGAYDFVTKPLDVEELERVLDKAVRELAKTQQAIEASRQLEETRREKERIEYSRRLQKEFFENVTHELRTPLTLLLGPLESAFDLSQEEAVRRFLNQAKRNGRLLLDLINQLLDFARIDARRMDLELQPVEAVALGRDLIAAFRPLAEEKDLQLQFSASEENIELTADPPKLLRILMNLLSNAVKFTSAGGRVELRLVPRENRVDFHVKDNGSGIPAEQLDRIFERFGRGDAGENSAYPGTGIGLALSRALAELHGGQIELHSEPGVGSEFILQLPRHLSAQRTAGGFSSQTPELPEAAPTMPSPEVQNPATEDAPHLLLVEDNPDMRRYIVDLLQGGFRLETAENGQIGWEKARKTVPDLIISDWMMPELDGVGMLELLRHERSTSHIPVILLTAKAQADHRVEGLQTGAEAYLSKPFHPEELRAQIQALLDQRERLRERFRRDFLRPEKVKAPSMEDQFLGEVKRVMEAHLNDELFGVEMMADELAMSRRTLGRKLNALTGESPVRFIRNYRLERARQMLVTRSAPVWEVALKTGFGSSSYFTKCFKDHYGISPREAVDRV